MSTTSAASTTFWCDQIYAAVRKIVVESKSLSWPSSCLVSVEDLIVNITSSKAKKLYS